MTTLGLSEITKAIRMCSHAVVGNGALKVSAVMIVLFCNSGEYWMVLNRRSHMVGRHKGEISFPGGVKDPSDAGLLFTALRETNEEMGIEPSNLKVLGSLDNVVTSTGYIITPFVGIIKYPYEYSVNRMEVEEVLEVRLLDLFRKELQRDEVHIRDGEVVKSPIYSFDGRLVYGATARILQGFAALLDRVTWEESSC